MAHKPTLPLWIPNGEAARITDPGLAKRDLGFIYKEKPPFQYFNWALYNLSQWTRGMQTSYFNIVVGSTAEKAANEATHTIDEVIDANVPAASKILILEGTHTLTADMALSNADLLIQTENPSAIIDVATFQILLTGVRQMAMLRVTSAGDNDIQLSGAGSHFEGIDIGIKAIQVSGGSTARTSGLNGGTKDGTVILGEGASVAAAATTDVWATDGNSRHITGNGGPITSFGTAPRPGAVMWVTLDGTPTLTNSANLSLQGGVDITAVAGDVARIYANTITQFDVQYFRKDGSSIASPITTYYAESVLDVSLAVGVNTLIASFGSVQIPTRGLMEIMFTGRVLCGGIVISRISFGIHDGTSYYMLHAIDNGTIEYPASMEIDASQYSEFKNSANVPNTWNGGPNLVDSIDIEAAGINTGLQTVQFAMRASNITDPAIVQGVTTKTRCYLKVTKY